MLTTTFLPAFCAFLIASRIWSDASAEPPGELTRKRIALTSSSSVASRMALAIVSPPIDDVTAERTAAFGLAVVDLTVAVDEGDRRTADAFPRAADELVVLRQLHELGLAAGAGECRVFGFVVVALLVDQLLVDRFLRQVRRGVDERHDLVARHLAVGGDPGRRAFEDRTRSGAGSLRGARP